MPRILTVDLGNAGVKAALFEGSPRSLRLLDLASRPVAAGQGIAQALALLVGERIGSFDQALSAISGELASYRFLELPFSDWRKLEQTVPFELEAHTPFDLDGNLVSFTVIDKTEQGGSLVLAALSPEGNVRSHLHTLAQAEIDPTAVDLAELAAANLLLLVAREEGTDQALVDLSGRRLLIASIQGGRLAGVRSLLLEEQEINPQHVARDLRWSLLASAKGGPLNLEQIWLGGVGDLAKVASAISNELAVPVRSLNQAPLEFVPPHLRHRQAEFVVPLGLGLREDTRCGGLALNFRQKDLAYHGKREELWRRSRRLALLAATALILLGTVWMVESHRRERYLSGLKNQIRQVFRETLPSAHRVVNEKAQLEAALAKLEEKRRLFGGALASVPRTIDVIRAMTAAVPPGAGLAVQELTIEGETVRLAASVPSFEAVDTVKNALSSVPLFSEVTVREVKTSVDGQRVTFQLGLTAKGS